MGEHVTNPNAPAADCEYLLNRVTEFAAMRHRDRRAHELRPSPRNLAIKTESTVMLISACRAAWAAGATREQLLEAMADRKTYPLPEVR